MSSLPTFDAIFVDHYDSFSWNIVEMLTKIAAKITTFSLQAHHTFYDTPIPRSLAQSLKKACIILSPGPKSPEDMQASQRLYQEFRNKHAFLGICLGHQIIGVCEGYSIQNATSPIHGTTRTMHIIKDTPLLPHTSYKLAAYNSLCLKASHKNTSLNIQTLAYDNKGDIAAIGCSYDNDTKSPPVLGVQLHPESFLSEGGEEIVKNFLTYYHNT